MKITRMMRSATYWLCGTVLLSSVAMAVVAPKKTVIEKAELVSLSKPSVVNKRVAVKTPEKNIVTRSALIEHRTWPLVQYAKPWSVMVYRGAMTNDVLIHVMYLRYSLRPERIYTAEIARELPSNNPVSQFFKPVVSTMQLAFNVGYRTTKTTPIYEIDPYVMFRWVNFPWNHWVSTTLGAGEGVSYVSRIPERETMDNTQNLAISKRFLNFLAFEATFAPPGHPDWQLVGRIHHRSGAYGLYRSGNSGSSEIGIGIRHYW